jgi:hypothetical protein
MVFGSSLTHLIAQEDVSIFICCENLTSYIMDLYGEETHGNIQCLENLRNKKASLLHTLALMLGCRGKQVVPTCIKV